MGLGGRGADRGGGRCAGSIAAFGRARADGGRRTRDRRGTSRPPRSPGRRRRVARDRDRDRDRDLNPQQAPLWIFGSSERSGGAVASGRRLASIASMLSLWLTVLNSVPSTRSTVSSGRWSCYSSTHGATNHTAAAAACPAFPNRIWPWQTNLVLAYTGSFAALGCPNPRSCRA